MFSLIVLLIFGLITAFFAIHNTGNVEISLGNSFLVYSVPKYVLVIGAMIVGFFVSWVLSVFGSISYGLKLRGKDSAINQAHSDINKLEQKIHDLEIENANLRGKNDRPLVREETNHPSLAERLKTKLNPAY